MILLEIDHEAFARPYAFHYVRQKHAFEQSTARVSGSEARSAETKVDLDDLTKFNDDVCNLASHGGAENLPKAWSRHASMNNIRLLDHGIWRGYFWVTENRHIALYFSKAPHAALTPDLRAEILARHGEETEKR